MRVIDAIKPNKMIMMYMPDPEDLVAKKVERQFIFDVVNTLEPTYFPRMLKEISLINRGQMAQDDADMIHIE